MFFIAAWPFMLLGVLVAAIVGFSNYQESEDTYRSEVSLFLTPSGGDTSALVHKWDTAELRDSLNSEEFYAWVSSREDKPADVRWSRSSFAAYVVPGVSAVALQAFQSSPTLAVELRDYLASATTQFLLSSSQTDSFRCVQNNCITPVIESAGATLYESRKSLVQVMAVSSLFGVALGILGGVLMLTIGKRRSGLSGGIDMRSQPKV